MFTEVGEGYVLYLKPEILCCLASPLYLPQCSVSRTTPGTATQHCPVGRDLPRPGLSSALPLGNSWFAPKSQFPHLFHASCGQRTFDLSSPLIWEASQSSRKQGKVNVLGKYTLPSVVLPEHLAFKYSAMDLELGFLKYTLFIKSGSRRNEKVPDNVKSNEAGQSPHLVQGLLHPRHWPSEQWALLLRLQFICWMTLSKEHNVFMSVVVC